MPRSFLQFVRIKGSIRQNDAGIQGSGLLQQFVYQSGLAMIDMGDNCDIAKFLDHPWMAVI